jgi:hypothetical protein
MLCRNEVIQGAFVISMTHFGQLFLTYSQFLPVLLLHNGPCPLKSMMNEPEAGKGEKELSWTPVKNDYP